MKYMYRKWTVIKDWCREYWIFLILLMVMDIFTGGFLWLMDVHSFGTLFWMFVGVSVELFIFGVWYSIRKEKRIQKQLGEMLEHSESLKITELPVAQQQIFQQAFDRIRELEQEQKQLGQQQRDYEDYIESWAHEIKVPLSLMTLLLNNRKEDMSPAVYEKMCYVNRKMQDYVTQILYYARLKAVHKDYVMEQISLKEICEDLQEQYAQYLTESDISFINTVEDVSVLSDRKGLQFMLGQIMNNACKYVDHKKEQSYIELTSCCKEQQIWLQVRDNGVGTVQGDLPFLFDKGFTGRTLSNQAKATGMGLYLVAQMAKDLSLFLDVDSKEEEGFMVQIGFPIVKRG